VFDCLPDSELLVVQSRHGWGIGWGRQIPTGIDGDSEALVLRRSRL
jgi:hypothetical protein